MNTYEGPPPPDLLERALRKYEVMPSGCWEWRGVVNNCGYGQAYGQGRRWLAHRVVWIAFRGQFPVGLVADHLCRNRRCVNPDHIEPVTQRENSLRGTSPFAQHAAATSCVNGHPFDEENTIRPRRGGRRCRQCSLKRDRDRMRARRLAELAVDTRSRCGTRLDLEDGSQAECDRPEKHTGNHRDLGRRLLWSRRGLLAAAGETS